MKNLTVSPDEVRNFFEPFKKVKVSKAVPIGRKASLKKWREKNRERLSEYAKDYAKENREKLNAYFRDYYAKKGKAYHRNRYLNKKVDNQNKIS